MAERAFLCVRCSSGGQFLNLESKFGKATLCAVVRTAGKTATLAAVEAAKEHLRTFYLEQLLQREKPSYRTEQGWRTILVTAQNALNQRLESIHSLEELFQFAGKCLKDPELRAAFEFLSAEECVEQAIPWENQLEFLRSSAEHHNIERDLSLFEQAISEVSKGSPTASSSATSTFRGICKGKEELGDLGSLPAPLLGSSPKRAKFSPVLKSGAVIDLDSEEERL